MDTFFSQFLGGGSQNQNNNQQQQQQQQRNQYGSSTYINGQSQNGGNNFMDPFAHFPNIFGSQFFSNIPGFGGQNSQQGQQQYQQNHQQQQQQQPQQQQEYFQRQPSFKNTRTNFYSNKNENQKKKPQKKELHEGQSEYWKLKGNAAFKQHYYDTAIEMYTRAINIDGSQSIYFANRGKCYKMKGSWDNALQDAQTAIELDEHSIKAYLLCGQCLAQISKTLKGKDCLNKIENSIRKMTKALTLCPTYGGEKQKQYERELSIYLLRAKKLLWYKNYEAMKEQKIEIIKNYTNYLDNQFKDDEDKKKQMHTEFMQMIGDPKQPLNMVIPSHLICKITYDMMEEPVTNSVGQTYEREVIEEAIKKNGLIDPLTRQPIKKELYQNHAVKQGIDEFLSANPWAFEFNEDQDYTDIQF